MKCKHIKTTQLLQYWAKRSSNEIYDEDKNNTG